MLQAIVIIIQKPAKMYSEVYPQAVLMSKLSVKYTDKEYVKLISSVSGRQIRVIRHSLGQNGLRIVSTKSIDKNKLHRSMLEKKNASRIYIAVSISTRLLDLTSRLSVSQNLVKVRSVTILKGHMIYLLKCTMICPADARH